MRNADSVSKCNQSRLTALVHALAAIIEADDYARVTKETRAHESNPSKRLAA